MAETTVEKITRNKAGSTILTIFGALLVVLIGYNFYKMFHVDAANSMWLQFLYGLQIVVAFISFLWLALILLLSSMTMSEPSFKRTSPYTVCFFFAMGVEIIKNASDSTGHQFWFWVVVGVAMVVVLLLQMLAFSLDPHSNSIFTVFRPFRIEILTVIRLSSQAPSPKRVARNSIV